MSDEPPKEDLQTLLQWLVSNANGIPDVADVDEFFPFGADPFRAVFGNWRMALSAADINLTQSRTSLDERFIQTTVPVHVQNAYEAVVQWADETDDISYRTVEKQRERHRRETEPSDTPTYVTGVTREDIRDDFTTVSEIVDRPPTAADLTKHGRWNPSRYVGGQLEYSYETWEEAWLDIGYTPEEIFHAHGYDYDWELAVRRTALLSEATHIADDLGHAPTWDELGRYSRFSAHDYREEFDSLDALWSEADVAVKPLSEFEPMDFNIDPSVSGAATVVDIPSHDMLLSDIRWLEGRYGHDDLAETIERHGLFETEDYEVQFGGIDQAIELVGVSTHQQH